MVTWVPGYSSCTASASTCAASWRISSSASGSRRVTNTTLASLSMVVARSTSLPSSFMARAARARPGPIASATVVPVTGASKRRTEPSGRVMAGMGAGPLVLGRQGGVDEGNGGETLPGLVDLWRDGIPLRLGVSFPRRLAADRNRGGWNPSGEAEYRRWRGSLRPLGETVNPRRRPIGTRAKTVEASMAETAAAASLITLAISPILGDGITFITTRATLKATVETPRGIG